ncbi:hypothetical protein NT90_16260 [Acinetobacter baumannii]|nr:hypothetical protein NT90_16260 [Acinetobacter baumannii]
MSNNSKKSQCLNLTSFIQEYMGKEVDIKLLDPHSDVTGMRLVATAKSIRCLCRLTFQGKKLSKTLGPFAHKHFESELPQLVTEVKVFNQRILSGLHPFENLEEQTKNITFGTLIQEFYASY